MGGALSLRSMDGVRVKLLLVVLAGNLLLASVQAWKPVDENKLRSFYELGDWMDPEHMSLPGNALVQELPTARASHLNTGVLVKMETKCIRSLSHFWLFVKSDLIFKYTISLNHLKLSQIYIFEGIL